MTEMVKFFKLSYYSYRGGKKLHQISSGTCIYRTVFELKNILILHILGMPKMFGKGKRKKEFMKYMKLSLWDARIFFSSKTVL